MTKFPVLILNYKRPSNIKNVIIPALMKEDSVSKIIIAHGNKECSFDVDELEDNSFKHDGKILHVTQYQKNEELRCYRRWELIYNLRNMKILVEECILVQDDDLVFYSNEINRLYKCLKEKKGVLISGVSGRNVINDKYNIANIRGKCDIVIGRSIFGYVSDICYAFEEAQQMDIPKEVIFEDDILISCVILRGKSVKHKNHYSLKLIRRELPDNDAISDRPNHVEQRNKAVSFFLNKMSIVPELSDKA